MLHAHTWSSGEGRKKLSSKPTLTLMMTFSKSANKRDYDDKGTYDNCGRAIGIYCCLLLHQSPPLHAPGLQCWQKVMSPSWRGRKKSSSTPTSTLIMATPNSANKWDYNDKGTYDNLQIAVAHHLIDLRNGSETHRTNKTFNDGYRKDTALNEANYSPKKDVHSGKN